MDNFRRPSPQPRRALDGFTGSRQQRSAPKPQPTSQNQRRTVGGTQLKATGRKLDDFAASEGFHVANASVNAETSVQRSSAIRPNAEKSGLPKRANPWPDKLDELTPALPNKKKHKKVRSKKRLSLKKFMYGALAAIGVMGLLVGFLVIKGYINLNKTFKGGSEIVLSDNVDPSYLNKEGDSRVNFLMLGRGGDGHDGADLTDTIIIASIDPVTNRADMVSIPRDLWVKTDYGTTKVNAVYSYGKQRAESKGKKKADAEAAGIDAIRAEISKISGIKIHAYVMVDFKAFEDAINTVGGVDINVTKETAVSEHLWDPVRRKPYYLNVQPGMQHFDGIRALFYARSRHTSPRGDFDRAERQRLLLQALSDKVTSAGTYSNPIKINQLMDNFGSHVSTDVSTGDALNLLKLGKRIGGNFHSVDLAENNSPIMTTGMISGQSIVRPIAGLFDYTELQLKIRTAFKDGYLARENAPVKVVNGTNTGGLATDASDLLKSYGYNVFGEPGTAPSRDYDKTVVVDLTKSNKKPYTRNYLEKRFGTKAVTTLPAGVDSGNAEFVIILGRNEATNSQD